MKDMTLHIPTFDDMLAAHDRIRPHIRRTPVRSSDYLNELSGAQLFFKCENFQEPGAFKVRGATNAVFGLSEAQASSQWFLFVVVGPPAASSQQKAALNNTKK